MKAKELNFIKISEDTFYSYGSIEEIGRSVDYDAVMFRHGRFNIIYHKGSYYRCLKFFEGDKIDSDNLESVIALCL